LAQSLKKDSAYVGASLLHYDCYFIQEAHRKQNTEKMKARYSRLIEDAIYFIEFTERFLKQNPSPFIETEKIITIDCREKIKLADGYSLMTCE